MRCSSIFYSHLRKLSKNLGKLASTAVVLDTFYVKYCAVLESTKNCITTSNLHAISCDKKSFFCLLYSH